MSEHILRDKHLTFIESVITVLFYITMISSASLISYGVYLTASGSTLMRASLSVLSVIGSFAIIIGLSTAAQNAYSGLYDDIHEPRKIRFQQDGSKVYVKAKKLPRGTSLILAKETETNIADYHNTVRELQSADRDFFLEETDEGIQLVNNEQTELFPETDFDDLRMYIYRNSPQCRWVGDSMEVNIQ